ncbi:hypothetical protein IAD21_04869 [Abditibacteriota bacterium]|nr:hypothetical protein IAD21_04869 [Abditibacteriota bacterium]
MKNQLFTFVALVCAATSALAAPKPFPLFADGAVLVRDKPLVVFGDGANPGETVSVSLLKKTATATADDKGNWKVALPAFKAGGPYDLKIAAPSGETVSKGVLVGDLWLCAGQSNMGVDVKSSDVAPIAEAAPVDPQLKIFGLSLIARPYPFRTLNEQDKAKWRESSPESARGTSAVAWSFAHNLRAQSGIPVGIVVGAWGGTRAIAWTPREALQKDFSGDLARFDDKIKDIKPDFDGWWVPALGYPDTPTYIYNAIINPLVPTAFTGVVWYQGEQDGGMGMGYTKSLSALISGWRDKFQDPTLPFLVVQLPAFGGDYCDGFPSIRAAQAAVVKDTANTALVVSVDTGDPKTIHPTQKAEIGRRAALAAQGLVHGAKIHWQAPFAQSAEDEDGSVRVGFQRGLSGLQSLDNKDLRAFELAGEDGKWVAAQASIAPNAKTVSVKADGLAKPLKVRYAVKPYPDANLGTKDGLAAAPFVLDVTP